MKKAYVQFNENSTSAFLSRFEGSEQFALYVGVEAVYGGWLLETSGPLTCLNELEDAECDSLIRSINEIIADPATPWEALSEADEEEISDTLAAWGIA